MNSARSECASSHHEARRQPTQAPRPAPPPHSQNTPNTPPRMGRSQPSNAPRNTPLFPPLDVLRTLPRSTRNEPKCHSVRLPEFEPPSRRGHRDLREILGGSQSEFEPHLSRKSARRANPNLLSLRSLWPLRLGG